MWFLVFSEDLPDGVEFEVVGDIKKLLEEQKQKAAAEDSNGKTYLLVLFFSSIYIASSGQTQMSTFLC